MSFEAKHAFLPQAPLVLVEWIEGLRKGISFPEAQKLLGHWQNEVGKCKGGFKPSYWFWAVF